MYFPLSELNGWGKRPATKAEDDLFRGSLVLWMQSYHTVLKFATGTGIFCPAG